MDLTEFIQVGYTLRPRGLKGELTIKFEFSLKEEKVSELKTLFLEIQPDVLPYFVENIKAQGDKFIIKFEDVTDRDKAFLLGNHKVHFPKNIFEDFFESPLKTTNYEALIGYSISDEENALLGKIEDILHLPQQKLAQISYKNREVLIPLNEESIMKVNEKEKRLQVKIPEGLLDIYLE